MENITKLHEDLFVFLEQQRENNKDLRYSLRKNNFGNRLQKGYWFLGDDQNLILSFWKGENFYTKKPQISLNFEFNTQLIYLEVTVEKQEDSLFFQNVNKYNFLLDVLIRNLYFPEKDEKKDYIVFKYRLGSIDRWEDVLLRFLHYTKYEIDEIILQNQGDYFKESDNSKEVIGFIDNNTFRRNVLKITEYRRQFEEVREFDHSSIYNRERPFYIKSLKVSNFGPLHNIIINDIPTNNRWIFITGANGSGKTMILKSIAIALGQGSIPRKYFNDYNLPTFELEFIGAKNEIVNINRSGNDERSTKAKRTYLRGFAAYGIHRTIIRSNLTLPTRYNQFSKVGFLESILGEKITPLINFNDTIEEWNEVDNTNSKIEHRRHFMVTALLSVVPGLVDIHFRNNRNHSNAEFYFSYEDGEDFKVNYDQLSSGTKSIISFIADIIARFYKQQPEAYDPSEFRGVVIIDEIDLHLHPKGQKDLINSMNEIFPNIQFIVSTHSPIPLLGAPKNTVVYRVDRNKENGINVERVDTLIHLEDLLPNAILTSPIFGMDSIVSSYRDSSSRVITQDDYREVELSQKLRSRIDDFLTDRKQEELIKLFEDRRK